MATKLILVGTRLNRGLGFSLFKIPIMASSSTKKMTLLSSDGETFEIDEAVMSESKLIKGIIQNDDPLPITSKILGMLTEYCKKHHVPKAAAAAAETSAEKEVDDLEKWDAEFVKVDHVTLFDLLRASAFFGIKSLLKLTCRTVATRDFTPEEEEEISQKNQWDFE